ncbi:MAG: CHAD domain-containing protein, partial [Acetobacteraceae bacterium]|nr:CHAD domain-containing protein [Acetobacteraceae bacterium]
SLAERARALADDRAVRPRRSAAPSLAGVGTVGEAFMTAGAHLLDVLLAETPRCRLEAGPRGVHQSRVALRRLRSVVRVFRPAFDGPALRAWDRELGALARALGAARDWDVFLDGVGRSLAAAFPEDARATGLLAAAEGARAEAYAALGRTLAAPEFRALVWEGMKLLADPPRAEARPDRPAVEPDGPLTPFAAAVLRKRWKRLRAAGDQMGDLPAEALHEMRLDVKRLRYAAELFAPLFGGKRGRRLLRRLAALQDALGLANDAAVARGLAAQLPDPDPFAAGLVAGLSVGRAADSRDLALGHWQKTLKTKLFWK